MQQCIEQLAYALLCSKINLHSINVKSKTPRNLSNCNLRVQGGSNMTGTDLCVNKPHKSRSYLNHLVIRHFNYNTVKAVLKSTKSKTTNSTEFYYYSILTIYIFIYLILKY
jgi:hypothetical protein